MQRLNSRVISLAGQAQRRFVVDVAPGKSIWQGVSGAFNEQRIHSAHLDLMGATLESAVFYTGYPDPAGRWIAQYGAPNHLAGSMLISAMGIFGIDREDKPMLHCHGCLVADRGQLLGGHLDTDKCIVGHSGLRIYVSASDDIGFAAKLDATSGMFVFHPTYRERDAVACSAVAEGQAEQ